MSEYLYTPGEEIPVEAVDDGNGLPSLEDVVEVVGETEQGVQVAPIASQGTEGIGVVTQLSSDEQGNVVAGDATIIAAKPILALNESTDGSVSAGDEVQEDAGGGVVGFDGATTQTTTPLGQVFAAHAGKYGFGKGGKVAVALYR
jgi:hypothetical protein